ncbi:MAG: hypothetical protein V4689_00555 [Verrucomicrobiota bacterium]
MPHSPFTRFFGLAIVLAYALILIWPYDNSFSWGWQLMIALPFVIAVFSWSAVRDAPPFDDLAFHRTLPPGDGFAFRRVLAIHGRVLLGIALAVIAYGWLVNFGWQTISYGIVFLTLPVWAVMGAGGIAASLSSSRQYGRTWGYVAIFVIPIFSMTGIYLQRNYLEPEMSGEFYLSAPRTMVLAGALLYPLVWWLVAVKRRRALGFGLGTAIGALMPWIFVYGGFVEAPGRDDWEQPVKSQVTISRKAGIPAEGKWIPLDDVISISGLRQGEYINHLGFWARNGPRDVNSVDLRLIPDDPGQVDDDPRYFDRVAGRFEGDHIEWGERALWNHLRKQIPSHETFDFRDGKTDVPTHPAFLRPGESVFSRSKDGKLHENRPKLTAEQFTSATWIQSNGGVFRMEKAGEVDVATGGTCRLSGGGVLRVSPLKQDGDRFYISFRQYYQDLWQADGPWLEDDDANRNWGGEPWIIAVDESGKHAFALPLRYSNDSKVMFGRISQTVFDAGEAKTREQLAHLEVLRGCRLYIFWSRMTGKLAREVPPAH